MLNYRVNQTSDYCLPSDLHVNHQPRGPQQQKLQPLGAPKSHEIGEPKPLLFRRHSNLWRKTAWTCSIYVHLMFIHVILNKSEFFCCWLFSLPTSFVGPLDFQRIIVAKRQSFSKWPREASTNKFCGLCDKEVKGGSRPMLMAIFTYTYSCMCIYYMNIYSDIVNIWIYIYVWHEHCLHFYFFAVYCILHQHLYNYKRDYASYCECFLRVHHDPCGPLALKIWTHNTLKPSKLPMAIAHPLSLVVNLAWMIQSMRLLQVVLTYVLILCIIHVFYICLSLFIHLWMFRLKSPYAVGQSSLRCLNRVTWCPDAPLPRREGAPKHGTPCGGGEEMSGTRMEQLGVFMAN